MELNASGRTQEIVWCRGDVCLSHLQGDSGGLSGHGAKTLQFEKELKRVDSAEGG